MANTTENNNEHAELIDKKAPEEPEVNEPQLKEFSDEEVAQHNTAEDCWLIIGEPGEKKVYDVTKFLDDHPGGPEIILDVAGQNATNDFDDIGHSNDAKEQLKEYLIGKVKGDVKKPASSKSSASAAGAASSNNAKSDSGSGTILIALSIVVAIVALFLQFRPVQ